MQAHHQNRVQELLAQVLHARAKIQTRTREFLIITRLLGVCGYICHAKENNLIHAIKGTAWGVTTEETIALKFPQEQAQVVLERILTLPGWNPMVIRTAPA